MENTSGTMLSVLSQRVSDLSGYISYKQVMYECNQTYYNPKSEKVGTLWKTQIKKESSDF